MTRLNQSNHILLTWFVGCWMAPSRHHRSLLVHVRRAGEHVCCLLPLFSAGVRVMHEEVGELVQLECEFTDGGGEGVMAHVRTFRVVESESDSVSCSTYTAATNTTATYTATALTRHQSCPRTSPALCRKGLQSQRRK